MLHAWGTHILFDRDGAENLISQEPTAKLLLACSVRESGAYSLNSEDI